MTLSSVQVCAEMNMTAIRSRTIEPLFQGRVASAIMHQGPAADLRAPCRPCVDLQAHGETGSRHQSHAWLSLVENFESTLRTRVVPID